eukprot:CAMPEP_0182798642 /NCGR_PEP_ID=MMETSP0006_2-20121128/1455_1 /TAXON_ID=97485 /ORGANISM="Prymnesium parvum, Strain Texoma1" /LENGTH=40 /DNA_ID= /DNA_START= /DNA_END= /DNA_ORIENTATION=
MHWLKRSATACRSQATAGAVKMPRWRRKPTQEAHHWDASN